MMFKKYKIPFNKPFVVGNELKYIKDSVLSGHIAGDGKYSKLCESFFIKNYDLKYPLLTTSCTDALELASNLININDGDEIIIPSYTFVSTALPFSQKNLKIRFADSSKLSPNVPFSEYERLINKNTKIVVVMHYGGIACDLDPIVDLCKSKKIILIEDSAQAIHSYYKNKPLGTFGDMSCFSFHETKNIIAGEGGLWVTNNKNLYDRACVLRDKGTNRKAFYQGQVDKYEWVDIGSSYLPSELISAFLYAQLEQIETIILKRVTIWNKYYKELKVIENYGAQLPVIPNYSSNNGHIFYILLSSKVQRLKLINFLKKRKILATFHYQSLHQSLYFKKIEKNIDNLKFSDMYSDRLLRLPIYYEMSLSEVSAVIESVIDFFKLNN